ncbi:MAG: FAD-binding protein [Symploca sp. SIO1A3]|nr:FAD-binding protein [Symploca sp. SIO1A3]
MTYSASPNCLPSEIDVAIIGGGPGGAATAISLQQQGDKQVAILEKSRQEHFRIGETVPPNIYSVMQQLGAREILEKGEHLPSSGSSSAWGSSQLGYQDFFFSLEGKGWHLNRTLFDASLAEMAAEQGAILRRRVRVVGGNRLADGKWNLALLDEDGSPWELKTSFVVDATGRRSFFASKQGANRVVMDSLLAIAAVFELDNSAVKAGYTLVEAAAWGWWYAARLPNNRAIVTLMSDREQVGEHQFSHWKYWQAYLEQTNYVQEMLAGAIPASQLMVTSAVSQYLDQMTGDGWLAVGDAACTFDPLASAGIYKALRSGIQAAEAIANYFNSDTTALTQYEARTRHQFELYLEDKRHYYALEQRWPNSQFWQRRRFKIALDPSQWLDWEQSPESIRQLQGLKMYLPVRDLHLLCQLCFGGKQAGEVVGKFLAHTQGRFSAYRAIEALEYLLVEQIILRSCTPV